MELTKITKDIYFLPHNELNDRCVIGYIRGKEHILMVDAGASEAHVKFFFSKLQENNLPKPDFCVLTHWHWDHTYGLHATHTTSFATKETNRLLREMKTWTWSDQDMIQRIATGKDLQFSYKFQNIEYPDKDRICVIPATVVFENELCLDLGEKLIVLRQMQNSHSPDCCVVYIPTEKCIFLGDIIYEDLAPDTPVYYREKHTELVKELMQLDFEIVITGHQPPMSRKQLFEQLQLNDSCIILD